MKAITIHGLWAWAIVRGHKRWENRSWPTKYRGRLAVHCGLSRKSDAAAAELLERLGIELPSEAELAELRGKVIGAVDVVGCESIENLRRPLFETPDPFATGPHCIALAEPRALESPVACVGKLSLWELPDDVAKTVAAQLD